MNGFFEKECGIIKKESRELYKIGFRDSESLFILCGRNGNGASY